MSLNFCLKVAEENRVSHRVQQDAHQLHSEQLICCPGSPSYFKTPDAQPEHGLDQIGHLPAFMLHSPVQSQFGIGGETDDDTQENSCEKVDAVKNRRIWSAKRLEFLSRTEAVAGRESEKRLRISGYMVI